MLRIIDAKGGLPNTFPVDKEATFFPGQIAQFKRDKEGKVVCGVSEGIYSAGIIDDINSSYFTSSYVEEKFNITSFTNKVIEKNQKFLLDKEVKIQLSNSLIEEDYFTSNIKVNLYPRNGIILIPPDTELSGVIKPYLHFMVRYKFKIPNVPGDNTTITNGVITVWNVKGMIAETDQFALIKTSSGWESFDRDRLLFVNSKGLLTLEQQAHWIRPVAKVVELKYVNNSFTLIFEWLRKKF